MNRTSQTKKNWVRSKGREYADLVNDQMKIYHKTFSGSMALKAGSVNNGSKNRGCGLKIKGCDLVDLWMRQNDLDKSVHCAICSEKVSEWDVDHIVPLIKGGKNEIENIQLICENCHKEKNRRERDVFAEGEPLPKDAPLESWLGSVELF